MGNSASSELYDNDFELVIRVSKELDHLLQVHVDQEGLTLMEKINHVEAAQHLRPHLVLKMKNLVRWRNSLVHDEDCNSLFDLGTSRYKFKQDYQDVKLSLEKVFRRTSSTHGALAADHPQNNGGGMGGTAMLFGALAVGAMATLASLSSNEEEEEARRRRQQQQRNRGW